MKTKIYFSETCPTCCKASDNPYRSYNQEGKIVQGCIDEFHTGRLVTPSESSFWHNRACAKVMRQHAKNARNGGITKDPKHFSNNLLEV